MGIRMVCLGCLRCDGPIDDRRIDVTPRKTLPKPDAFECSRLPVGADHPLQYSADAHTRRPIGVFCRWVLEGYPCRRNSGDDRCKMQSRFFGKDSGRAFVDDRKNQPTRPKWYRPARAENLNWWLDLKAAHPPDVYLGRKVHRGVARPAPGVAYVVETWKQYFRMYGFGVPDPGMSIPGVSKSNLKLDEHRLLRLGPRDHEQDEGSTDGGGNCVALR